MCRSSLLLCCLVVCGCHSAGVTQRSLKPSVPQTNQTPQRGSGLRVVEWAELQVPRSNAEARCRPMVRVAITRRAILVEHNKLANVKRGEVSSEIKDGGQSGYLIWPLAEALVKQRARSQKIQRYTGRAPIGELMLVADHRTPYRLVSEVCYSAARAGFHKVNLVTVRAPLPNSAQRVRCIATASPRYEPLQQTIDSSRPAKGKQTPLSPARRPATQPAPVLTVAVSDRGFVVASDGAVLRNSRGSLPTISRTDGRSTSKEYPYRTLTKLVTTIKRRFPQRRKVVVSADRQIALRTVVRTLDALRGTSTEKCRLVDGCLFDHVVLSAGIQ
jgi:biopolymer transport protein ExbD